MTIPAWRQLLRGARQREGRGAAARWVQLATVAADGHPRVRTVVFRGWAGDNQLDLYSDSRSSKAEELSIQPNVEVCWLLPKAYERLDFVVPPHAKAGDQIRVEVKGRLFTLRLPEGCEPGKKVTSIVEDAASSPSPRSRSERERRRLAGMAAARG